MEHRQFESMLAVARARLARHAPEDIAEKAGVRYADGAFQVPTLGQTVTVRLPDCTIEPPLSNWHALTLLHLLDLADGTPPTGRTITLSQYKDGLVRGSGLDRNAELIVRRDLSVLPPEELEIPAQACRELRDTVSSLRLDAVLSAMLHVSRGTAAELIEAGRVEINHLPVEKPHAPVYEQDVFTVRGKGRFRLTALPGKSKKDRSIIEFFQY